MSKSGACNNEGLLAGSTVKTENCKKWQEFTNQVNRNLRSKAKASFLPVCAGNAVFLNWFVLKRWHSVFSILLDY